MLSSTHFYHRITRKIVVAFGTIFNNIKLYRYNKAGTVEIERVSVPLSYAGKEKFYQRITQDPNLEQPVQITLPRMAFEMTAITYDPLRKRSSFAMDFAAQSNTSIQEVVSAPYNLDFNLYVLVRNTEDGTQIIEQILPYFSPDYTVTVDLVGLNNLKVDVPIILQSINYELMDDTGSSENERQIMWTLTFTAKAMMYGPINSSKVIRKVTANTFNNTYNTAGRKKITVTNTTGTFKVGEVVYEGRELTSANATAFVTDWNATSNVLLVEDSSGQFLIGKNIFGAVSNTSATISAFQDNDNQLTNLTITPNPSTANANTAFGFSESLEIYPNIT